MSQEILHHDCLVPLYDFGMDLADWVKEARTHWGKTQTALGDALGVTKGNVSGWEKGRHKPSIEQMARISQITGYPVPKELGRNEPQPSSIPTEDEFSLIPQLDMYASCGDGKFVDHVVIKGGLAFKRTFMQQFGLSEEMARVIYASGESMEPTIGNGRVVLINMAERTPQDGRVFLICDQDGGLILKRLIREYDPTIQQTVWKIRSDNPDKRQYPDKYLPDDSRVTIVGRAIWHDGLL